MLKKSPIRVILALSVLFLVPRAAICQSSLEEVQDSINELERKIDDLQSQAAEGEAALQLRKQEILLVDRLDALRQQEDYLDKYRDNGIAVDGFQFVQDTIGYLRAESPDKWNETWKARLHEVARGQLVRVQGCLASKRSRRLVFSTTYPRRFRDDVGGHEYPFTLIDGTRVHSVFSLGRFLRSRDDETIGRTRIANEWRGSGGDCERIWVEGVVTGLSEMLTDDNRIARGNLVLDDWILLTGQ